MKSSTQSHTASRISSTALSAASLIVAMIVSLGLNASPAAAAKHHVKAKPRVATARLSAARAHRTSRSRESRHSVTTTPKTTSGEGTSSNPTSPASTSPTSPTSPVIAPQPTPQPSPEPAPQPSPEPTPQPSPEPSPEAPKSEPVPVPPSGNVLFTNGFESGFKGWYVQSLAGRATIVSGSAFAGANAARFEVRPGDVEPDTGSNRSEVSGPTYDEGQDLYIRDAIRVPSASTYAGSWQIVQQLHETEWSGSPGLAVFLDANRAISIGAGDGSQTFWRGPALQTDRWYELLYRVKLSQSPGVGFVEVWLNGAAQPLTNGQTKELGRTMQTSHAYIKAGIYRAKTSTGVSIVEHDGLTVATSREAALAG